MEVGGGGTSAGGFDGSTGDVADSSRKVTSAADVAPAGSLPLDLRKGGNDPCQKKIRFRRR